MVLGYPIGEIVLLAFWIAGAGILVGILAGLFGIGGGAIIIPVLYEVFRVIEVPEGVRDRGVRIVVRGHVHGL